MTLHVINKGDPACWQAMLPALQRGDDLLLTEESVYAALPAHGLAPLLTAAQQQVTLYALLEDLALRGISAKIRADVASISRADFVALCLTHERVVSWR